MDTGQHSQEGQSRPNLWNICIFFIVCTDMSKDLHFAWRMISTHRWFSAAVIVTITLGIGLNTMVFTLVNAMLFKPVTVQDGEQLVAILNEKHAGRNSETGVLYPDFRDY